MRKKYKTLDEFIKAHYMGGYSFYFTTASRFRGLIIFKNNGVWELGALKTLDRVLEEIKWANRFQIKDGKFKEEYGSFDEVKKYFLMKKLAGI